jgi:hypothetical protein
VLGPQEREKMSLTYAFLNNSRFSGDYGGSVPWLFIVVPGLYLILVAATGTVMSSIPIRNSRYNSVLDW